MFKRFILLIIALLGIFFVSRFVVKEIGIYLSPSDELSQADLIVVISGGDTDSRALEGVRLYKNKFADTIVFSGAALNDGPSNAIKMKELAIANGVDSGDIVIDQYAKNTLENAKNLISTLKNFNADKIILVTNEYHMRRAAKTFSKVLGSDVTIIRHPVIDDSWDKEYWYKTSFGRFITVSELWKILFINITGRASI